MRVDLWISLVPITEFQMFLTTSEQVASLGNLPIFMVIFIYPSLSTNLSWEEFFKYWLLHGVAGRVY